MSAAAVGLSFAMAGCTDAAARRDAQSAGDADTAADSDARDERRTASSHDAAGELDAASRDAVGVVEAAHRDTGDVADAREAPTDGSWAPPPVPSRVRWARAFPVLERGLWGFGSTSGGSVAAGAGGDVLVAGTAGGPVDLGGGRLDPPLSGSCIDSSGSSAVVARYRSTGEHVWSRRIGGTHSSAGQLLAATPTDAVALVGTFDLVFEVDGTRIEGATPRDSWSGCGVWDTYLALLRGSDGALAWARAWPGARFAGVVADSHGDVVAFGPYEGALDLGGGPLPDDGLGGYFVAKLSGDDGSTLWARGFPAAGPAHAEWASLVVLDDADDVFVSGSTGDTIDLGGGLLPDGGGTTMFVAKLSGRDGSHVWSRSFFGGAGSVLPSSAVVAQADVVVTGSAWDAPVDFGGGPMTAGRPAAFTVRLAGSDGSHVWSRALGGRALATSADGESLALVGSFTGALDCGGVTLIGPAEWYSTHGLVAWLRADDGSERWCESLPGDGQPVSVTVDSEDEITVTGSFQRSMSAGSFSLDPGMGFQTMFVVHLASGTDTGTTFLSDAAAPAVAASDGGPPPDSSAAAAPPSRTCPGVVTGAPPPEAVCPTFSSFEPRGCWGLSSCSNGVRDDVCMAEECDGADTGSETCESLGYGGGTLRCTSDCAFDVGGCDACPSDARVGACLTTGLVSPMALDMEVTADEIAVAWISGPSPWGEMSLRFATFDHDLRTRFESGCLAKLWLASHAFVSLARTARGWLIAASGLVPSTAPGGAEQAMLVLPLGEAGRPNGPLRTMFAAHEPRLLRTQGGSPLLLWQSWDMEGPLLAALLCDDGSEAWRVEAFESATSPSFVRGGTFTGDGFLVAGVVRGAGLLVRRLELDGSLGPPFTVSHSGSGAELAWDGSEARIVHRRFSDAGPDGTVWRRLSRTGAPLGDAVVLGRVPLYSGVSPIAMVGRDSVVLRASGTSLAGWATGLDVVRLDADGDTVGSPVPVRRDPSSVGSWHVESLAEDVFVGWASSGASYSGDWRRWRLGLLRLSP